VSASSYGSGLSGTAALADMLGLLEVTEGYGKPPNGPGAVYDDGSGNPTIGYGFDLTDTNSLGAVLDGLLPAGVTYIQGQTNQNVFVAGAAAAASGKAVESATAVVQYFSWFILWPARLVIANRACFLLACCGLFFGESYAAKVTVPRDASCGIGRAEMHSAQQIGAMFARASDLGQLLRNLKLAADDSLFLETHFYTEENLLKFFGASKVLTTTPNTSDPNTFVQREFKVFGSAGEGSAVTVNILKSCQLITHYRGPAGEVPTHVRTISSMTINLPSASPVTVSAVRSVFGRETRMELDTGETLDGMPVAVTSKGSLHYLGGAVAGADGEVKENSMIFVVKLPGASSSPTVRQIVDRDLVESVRIKEVER